MTAKLFHPTEFPGWTKAAIYAQLGTDGGEVVGFHSRNLHDEDVQEWVDGEFDARDLFPMEAYYCDEVTALNATLVEKTLARIAHPSAFASHAYQPGRPKNGPCRACGEGRTHKLHKS